MVDLLFVYGTLHPDRAPAEILPTVQRLTMFGPATIRGTLHDLGLYPGLTLPGDQWIQGTLFALPQDPAVLEALDAYEGFEPGAPATSLFLRTEQHVILPDDSRQRCWIYLYNQPSARKGG